MVNILFIYVLTRFNQTSWFTIFRGVFVKKKKKNTVTQHKCLDYIILGMIGLKEG